MANHRSLPNYYVGGGRYFRGFLGELIFNIFVLPVDETVIEHLILDDTKMAPKECWANDEELIKD